MKKINYLDLFSGLGGFSEGIRQSGIDFAWHGFSEIDRYAISIYKRHFPEAVELGNITGIDGRKLPHLNLITFGFPCQDLSIAGKRAGLEGKRSGLFYEATRIIEEARPHYFVWENVKGLMSSNNGKDIDSVCEEMSRIFYVYDFEEMNTSWFLPQNRERIYCIGVNLLWLGQNLNDPMWKKITKGYLLSNWLRLWESQKKPSETKCKEWELELVCRRTMLLGQLRRKKYCEIIRTWDYKSLKLLFLHIQSIQLNRRSTNLDILKNGLIGQMDTPLGMKESQGTVDLLGCIEKGLNNLSEENLQEMNRYITSILINPTTEMKTSFYVTIENIIWICIDRLNTLYPNYLKEAWLDLIEKKEFMKYVETIRSETSYNGQDDYELPGLSPGKGVGNDTIGHIRGKSRPKVFPIGESDTGINERAKQTTVNTLTAGGHSGGHHSSMTLLQTDRQTDRGNTRINPK